MSLLCPIQAQVMVPVLQKRELRSLKEWGKREDLEPNQVSTQGHLLYEPQQGVQVGYTATHSSQRMQCLGQNVPVMTSPGPHPLCPQLDCGTFGLECITPLCHQPDSVPHSSMDFHGIYLQSATKGPAALNMAINDH